MLASLQPLDHLCLMIPVVDWTTVFCANLQLRPVVSKLEAQGYSAVLLRQAYGLLSPVQYGVQVTPNRIQILYTLDDQLTPETVTLKYARQTGITQITGYARNHATILLTPSLYKKYDRFLKNLPE